MPSNKRIEGSEARSLMRDVRRQKKRLCRGRGLVLLFLKNLVFTLAVPGTFAVYLPWLIARGLPIGSLGLVLTSLVLVLIGGMIYIWCLWDFATFGRGTPAPIDALCKPGRSPADTDPGRLVRRDERRTGAVSVLQRSAIRDL